MRERRRDVADGECTVSHVLDDLLQCYRATVSAAPITRRTNCKTVKCTNVASFHDAQIFLPLRVGRRGRPSPIEIL